MTTLRIMESLDVVENIRSGATARPGILSWSRNELDVTWLLRLLCLLCLLSRMICRLTAICLGLSALAFAASLYVFGRSNQAPVAVPLPGPSQSVGQSFELVTGGVFKIEIAVPMPAGPIPLTLAGTPPIPSDLAYEILGPDVHLQESLKQLTRGAQYAAGRVDYYYGGRQIKLSRGRFSFTLTNHGENPFGTAGASLALVRVVPLTESFLLSQMVRIAAWVMFGLAMLFCAVPLIRRRRRM